MPVHFPKHVEANGNGFRARLWRKGQTLRGPQRKTAKEAQKDIKTLLKTLQQDSAADGKTAEDDLPEKAASSM